MKFRVKQPLMTPEGEIIVKEIPIEEIKVDKYALFIIAPSTSLMIAKPELEVDPSIANNAYLSTFIS